MISASKCSPATFCLLLLTFRLPSVHVVGAAAVRTCPLVEPDTAPRALVCCQHLVHVRLLTSCSVSGLVAGTRGHRRFMVASVVKSEGMRRGGLLAGRAEAGLIRWWRWGSDYRCVARLCTGCGRRAVTEERPKVRKRGGAKWETNVPDAVKRVCVKNDK